MSVKIDKNEESSAKPAKYTVLTDLKNPLLLAQFEKRGYSSMPDWHLCWTNTLTSKISRSYRHIGLFKIQSKHKINHFPNSEELCRKDLLVKNVQNYLKNKHPSLCMEDIDFLPATYRLPSEYEHFVNEYNANNHKNNDTNTNTWIIKPFDRCQGDGIFLVNQLAEVNRCMQDASNDHHEYLISRYIERPLLIGGRKFDLRLFVLVTSFRPLKAYLYNDGFCRFCCERYTMHENMLSNKYVHLTNVGVQKTHDRFNAVHGGKWSLKCLQLYLDSTHSHGTRHKLFTNIHSIIKHSLRAVQPCIHNGRNFFECFGYDILIDNTIKPWLIEVNSKPSLSGTTSSDYAMKGQLIEHILNVVVGRQKAEQNNFKVLMNENLV